MPALAPLFRPEEHFPASAHDVGKFKFRLVEESVFDDVAAMVDLTGPVAKLVEDGEGADGSVGLDVATLTRRRYPGPGAWKV